MSQEEIRAKVEAAVRYLTANPADARYTDSQATAALVDPDGLATRVNGPDDAEMMTDMPASVGGGNAAPSPGWYLRAAAASCVATLIAMRAAQESVKLERLSVTVDSESDDRGILGISDDVPGGPLHTRVVVNIRSQANDDDDEDVWQTIVDWAVEHCPVTDAIRRAVPLSVEINTNEER
jgi:uncharacterized OsmC-like protein